MFKNDAKKRMMYVQSDDLNFLSYVVLLTLSVCKCKTKKNAFYDYRKIAFIANYIFFENSCDWFKIYFNSQSSLKNMDIVVKALENKGYICIERNFRLKAFNLYIKDSSKIDFLINDEVFKKETNLINDLLKGVDRYRTVKLKTFLERMFEKNGVKVWEE